jgi:hypothetical protein
MVDREKKKRSRRKSEEGDIGEIKEEEDKK